MEQLDEDLKKAIEELTGRQAVLLALWDLFFPEKRDLWIKGVRDGKSGRFAFKDAI